MLRSTIRSGAYQTEILERNPKLRVFGKACPLFVPLIEEGWAEKRVTALVIEEYLSEMVREGVDALVLGCTHYPLLKKSIASQYPELTLVDSSVEVARSVAHEISRLDIAGETAGGVRIFLTDVTEQMERLEKLFFGMPFQKVEEVAL